MDKIIRDIYEKQAEVLRRQGISSRCEWFASTNIESIEDIFDVFYHPQALSFCQRNNYPPREIIDYFKPLNVDRFGVYIDAGDIELHNPEKVILIGCTRAKIRCDRGGHTVIAMHNAQASVVSGGRSVVSVFSNTGCKITAVKVEKGILTTKHYDVNSK